MDPPDNRSIKVLHETSPGPIAPPLPPPPAKGRFKGGKAGYGDRLVRIALGAVAQPIAAIGKALVSGSRAARDAVVHTVVYPMSSRISRPNKARLVESRAAIAAVGAEAVELRTSDGVVLKGQYLAVNNFTAAIERMGGVIYSTPLEGDASGIKMQQVIAFKDLSPENRAILEKMGITIIEIANEPDRKFCGVFPHHFKFEPEDESRSGVTVLFQGNAELYEYDRGKILETLTMGQNCLMFNIRGTGESSGSPTPKGTALDAEAAYQFVKAKGFEDRDITLRGRCLGSAIAVQLATKHRLDVILEQPPDNIAKVPGAFVARTFHKVVRVETPNADRMIIGMTQRLLGSSLEGYDSEVAMPDVKGDVLILEATADEIVPHGSADRLATAAKAKKALAAERGLAERVEVIPLVGTHNDVDRIATTLAISNFYRGTAHLPGLPLTKR